MGAGLMPQLLELRVLNDAELVPKRRHGSLQVFEDLIAARARKQVLHPH